MTAWTAKTMLARWTAMPNDLIGGWCVMAGDKPPSTAREPEVCDIMNQEIAEHVAGLHNRWLGDQPVTLTWRGEGRQEILRSEIPAYGLPGGRIVIPDGARTLEIELNGGSPPGQSSPAGERP